MWHRKHEPPENFDTRAIPAIHGIFCPVRCAAAWSRPTGVAAFSDLELSRRCGNAGFHRLSRRECSLGQNSIGELGKNYSAGGSPENRTEQPGESGFLDCIARLTS